MNEYTVENRDTSKDHGITKNTYNGERKNEANIDQSNAYCIIEWRSGSKHTQSAFDSGWHATLNSGVSA